MDLLITQCGGPTAVINASLAAFVEAAQENRRIERVFGARLGLEGLRSGDWVELTTLTRPQLGRLSRQPGAALGGGRYRPSEGDFQHALELLVDRGIGGVALIGGNGTMAAAHRLATLSHQQHAPVGIVGMPKTIDNDLVGAEVAPGYGSAARFISEMVQNVGLDLYSMRHFDDVVVIELMGRHAGWLAAAAALLRRPDGAPHMLLVPEARLNEADLLAQVGEIYARHEVCLIVAAEGVQDEEGNYLAEKQTTAPRDASGQRLLSLAAGVAPYLAARIFHELGLRCRQIRPDLIQRSCRLAVSEADIALARLTGAKAVETLAAGLSDAMIGLVHEEEWRTQPLGLASVVGRTQTLPSFYWEGAAFDLTAAGVDDLRRRLGHYPQGDAPLLW